MMEANGVGEDIKCVGLLLALLQNSLNLSGFRFNFSLALFNLTPVSSDH